MTLTLMQLMIFAGAVPMLAAAQVKPLPPAPRKMPAPMIPIAPKVGDEVHALSLVSPKLDLAYSELLEMQHELQWRAEEMRLHSIELAQVDVGHLKMQAEDLKMLDLEQLKVQANEAKQLALLELPKLEGLGLIGVPRAESFLNARPRAPWASEDPADSLYRVAREALNRGEYRRAAQTFNEVTRRFPASRYAQDCAYWEAFARYRLGTTEELKQALRILEGKGDLPLSAESLARVGGGRERSETAIDIAGLRARVQGALAARGDREAAAALQNEARLNGGCDREEVSVRAEALQALAQIDLQAAMPAVKKVLARRDECTVELRRRALYLLARQPDDPSISLMLDVAKNDTDPDIRREAMTWLGRAAGDRAVPMLEDILKSSTDERTQRSAVSALGSIDTDRARRAVRTIIERNDAPETVRHDAIMSLSRARNDRQPSADDLNYLRSLYAKLTTPRLKEAVLTSVSRVSTPENEQFLLALARNQSETPSLRATALQRLGRMSSISVSDIAKLYDAADARSLREQILRALYERKEPEAVDKMMEIARKDTDPHIRRYAISLLARRNDPRATALLQELIDK